MFQVSLNTITYLIDTPKNRRYTEDTQLKIAKIHMSPSSAPDLRIALECPTPREGAHNQYIVNTYSIESQRPIPQYLPHVR